MLVDSQERTDSRSFLQVTKRGPKKMLSLVSRGCSCPSPEDATAEESSRLLCPVSAAAVAHVLAWNKHKAADMYPGSGSVC